MLATYGYQDGSGEFFITIDTEKCNGCGKCAEACPATVYEVVEGDPNDPLREEPVAMVAPDRKNKLKYECNACKPSIERLPLACMKACKAGAISHSW